MILDKPRRSSQLIFPIFHQVHKNPRVSQKVISKADSLHNTESGAPHRTGDIAVRTFLGWSIPILKISHTNSKCTANCNVSQLSPVHRINLDPSRTSRLAQSSGSSSSSGYILNFASSRCRGPDWFQLPGNGQDSRKRKTHQNSNRTIDPLDVWQVMRRCRLPAALMRSENGTKPGVDASSLKPTLPFDVGPLGFLNWRSLSLVVTVQSPQEVMLKVKEKRRTSIHDIANSHRA
ncbi:hypothetical protein FB45DRAFT_84170 [Roridomyces roridus]|uniref:Uncharacterized protein n=1 Tax=Roridomyces roridus TaxID=1738132 RepID=A0AAD7BLB6_9AGAR|nr:hypothetical protein FB45DRAFT_84170 [Roridomyces roridus]